jgi:hypothetical protein
MQAIGGKLYLVGGWSGSLPTAEMAVYDIASDRWSSAAAFPTRTACGQSGVINGQLFVLNACDGFSGYVHDFYSYDPAADAWTPLSNPDYDHAYGVAGVVEGRLYVAGGYDDALGTHNRLEIYDPATGSWSIGASMPGVRNGGGAAVVNDVLYVVGGYDGTNDLASTVAYDPATNVWRTLADLLPEPFADVLPEQYHRYHQVLADGNRLYVFGGFDLIAKSEAYVLDLPTSADGGSTPSATIELNQNSFTAGSSETLRLSGTILAGNAAGTRADVYILAEVAGYGTYYLGPNLAWGIVPLPIVAGFALDDLAAPNFYQTSVAGLPAASYTFKVIVARAGGNPALTADVIAADASQATLAAAVQPPVDELPPPAQCDLVPVPASQGFGATGGNSWFSMVLSASGSCLIWEWQAVSNAAWITNVFIYARNLAEGEVSYSVQPNTGRGSRTGTISVAGKTFTVTQEGTNPFQGEYQGSWSGECLGWDVGGSFTMSIDSYGSVRGTYSGAQSGSFSGEISSSGSMSTASGVASGGAYWTGQFVTGGGGSGGWSLAGCSGGWATQ